MTKASGLYQAFGVTARTCLDAVDIYCASACSASRGDSAVANPSVCLCIHLFAGIVSKWMDVSSHFFDDLIEAFILVFLSSNAIRYKIPRGTPPVGALNTGDGNILQISPFILEMLWDRPIVTINVKNCSLSTTYNGEMTHRKQQK